VAAIAIKLYGVARTLTRSAAIFAAFGRRTTAGWILTDFFVLIVRHLSLPPMNVNCLCLAQHISTLGRLIRSNSSPLETQTKAALFLIA
jgi:hypothetical protein